MLCPKRVGEMKGTVSCRRRLLSLADGADSCKEPLTIL